MNGRIVMVCIIAVCVAALVPLQRITHPSDMMSMRVLRVVLCWTGGDDATMLASNPVVLATMTPPVLPLA